MTSFGVSRRNGSPVNLSRSAIAIGCCLCGVGLASVSRAVRGAWASGCGPFDCRDMAVCRRLCRLLANETRSLHRPETTDNMNATVQYTQSAPIVASAASLAAQIGQMDYLSGSDGQRGHGELAPGACEIR